LLWRAKFIPLRANPVQVATSHKRFRGIYAAKETFHSSGKVGRFLRLNFNEVLQRKRPGSTSQSSCASFQSGKLAAAKPGEEATRFADAEEGREMWLVIAGYAEETDASELCRHRVRAGRIKRTFARYHALGVSEPARAAFHRVVEIHPAGFG
jgi:hypothetical protein